jgi:hypothetical protein
VPTLATHPDQQLALVLLNFHMIYFPAIDEGQTGDYWDENAESVLRRGSFVRIESG